MKPQSGEQFKAQAVVLDSTLKSTPADEHALGEMASTYLDALRAIAANLVIGAHISIHFFGVVETWLGSLGVTLFFLLSGFLIMQSMLNRLHRPKPWMPRFLADRTARILTPYLPALVLIALANLLIIDTNFATGNGLNRGFFAFLGNLFLLQDHTLFQILERGGIDLAWRIRPYNTAEPFWTVAVEMWIYVSAGLFVFCLVEREKIARSSVAVLVLLSVPVLVWNAAAGGGKTLTLTWLLGAIAGLLFHLWRENSYENIRSIGGVVALGSLVALVGRIGKAGFDPYDFQCATLLAMLMFGILAVLMSVKSVPAIIQHPARFLAAYSYSLYLVHNTVLIIVFQNVQLENLWAKIALSVVVAHICAYFHYVAFERHYRRVAIWLRPKFARVLAPPTGTSGQN